MWWPDNLLLTNVYMNNLLYTSVPNTHSSVFSGSPRGSWVGNIWGRGKYGEFGCVSWEHLSYMLLPCMCESEGVCVKTQSVILFSGKKAVCHLEKGWTGAILKKDAFSSCVRFLTGVSYYRKFKNEINSVRWSRVHETFHRAIYTKNIYWQVWQIYIFVRGCIIRFQILLPLASPCF